MSPPWPVAPGRETGPATARDSHNPTPGDGSAMRIGTFLPHMGAASSPELLIRSAQHAEALGYDSLWVAERLLYPLAPRNPYPGMPEGSLLPDYYRRVFQPIESLTFVATVTKTIRLGTSVLNMPYHNP